MGAAWIAELVRLATVVVLALLAGALLGSPAGALALASAAYLAWHLWNLWRLDSWLARSQRFAPPEADGIWGEVFHHYWQMRRQDRARKRRLAEVLRAFRDATTAMPDGTVVLDRNLEVLWCNEAAQQLLGLRAPQDYGQRIANLLRHPDFVRFLAERGGRDSVEIPAPVGAQRWLVLHLVEYGEGQSLLLARDATRLHQLEKMRREFVANASHELRSPLTVIGGYLEALDEDPHVRDAWRGPLDEMRRQAARMGGIVDDLLELSRLETEVVEPIRAPVDVRGILARVREEALALGDGPPDVTLVFDTDLDLLGEEREIHSAVSNLVFNAMRYTPRGGRVVVRWAAAQGAPVLTVTDTGIGIPPEHIPRITERFYRVDPSRSRSRGGTGLGLAIVKHVVQRHGGTLRIESQPGRGSTFTCAFPADRAVRRGATPLQPPRHGPATGLS